MSSKNDRKPLFLLPNEGRRYTMGPMEALFLADNDETASGYSISQWWLEPHTSGPGAHSHPEDDVFFVIDGTMSFLVGDEWIDAPRGSFVLAPGGVTHDFENRSDARARMLNVFAPGDFEPRMPDIAAWFRERSPDDSTC